MGPDGEKTIQLIVCEFAIQWQLLKSFDVQLQLMVYSAQSGQTSGRVSFISFYLTCYVCVYLGHHGIITYKYDRQTDAQGQGYNTIIRSYKHSSLETLVSPTHCITYVDLLTAGLPLIKLNIIFMSMLFFGSKKIKNIPIFSPNFF